MNRKKVIIHRAEIRFKRLFYLSRIVFSETPVNYDLIVAISLKMNRLIKVIESDMVAVNGKIPVK